jgi:cell division protein FtsI (penicillin-binding protein 3)
VDFHKQIMKKVMVIYVILLLISIGIAAKVFHVQVVEGPEWREKSHTATYVFKRKEAARGNILAADGSFLAISVPVYKLRWDSRASGITDAVFSSELDSLTIMLARFFPVYGRTEWRQRLQGARKDGNRYYTLVPEASHAQAMAARTFPIFRLGNIRGGLILEESSRREKPLGQIAARTIGRPEGNSRGVGLEAYLDDALRGTEGVRLMEQLSGNVSRPVESSSTVEPVDGLDVVCTLDPQIQEVAHEELARQLRINDASHGCVVVMETATGNVMAMANLSRTSSGDYREIYNYAIGELSDPGSTMKLLTLLALLEDGFITPSDSISTGDGTYKVHSHTIRDTREGGHGRITIKRSFEVSSNVAMAKLVSNYYQKDPSRFTRFFEQVKLNEPTGIEIHGEAIPYLKTPADSTWSGLTLPMMSMGYEMSVTPLQILAFYNAIANDGYWVKPRLVSEYRSRGRTVRSFPVVKSDKPICSTSTLESLKDMLIGVVENGTAQNLKDHAIPIAGKTGTAKIAKGQGGYVSEYKASFCGFFPAHKPKYSCIVVVTNPAREGYYGNVVAGPIFRAIADQVYSSNFAINKQHYGSLSERKSERNPYPGAGYAPEFEKVFTRIGLVSASIAQAGDWVQSLSGGTSWKALRLSPDLVPEVVGMGGRDAIYLLNSKGFEVQVSGVGRVKRQLPLPGEVVTDKVYLELGI